MNRLTSFLIALAISLPVLSGPVFQGGDDIPLHDNRPPVNIPHAPSLVPISCYLMSSASSIILYSATITTNAHVELENTSTGLTYSCDIVISSVPVPISLLGPGEYLIEITLPSGVLYTGLFSFYGA